MNKKCVLVFALLPLLLCGCDDSPKVSNSSATPTPASYSAPASSNDSPVIIPSSTHSVSTTSNKPDTPAVSSNPTSASSSIQSSSMTETIGQIIGKKVKAETNGKYVNSKEEDEDTFTYTFSYLGNESFTIASSITNKNGSYSFNTSVTFNWGNLKDAVIYGEATEGSNSLLRCYITCDYGIVPEITYKSHEVEASNSFSDKQITSKAKELVTSHKKAYQAIQAYIKIINSNYTLW